MRARTNEVEIVESFCAVVKAEECGLREDGCNRKTSAPLRLVLLSKSRGIEVKADLQMVSDVG